MAHSLTADINCMHELTFLLMQYSSNTGDYVEIHIIFWYTGYSSFIPVLTLVFLRDFFMLQWWGFPTCSCSCQNESSPTLLPFVKPTRCLSPGPKSITCHLFTEVFVQDVLELLILQKVLGNKTKQNSQNVLHVWWNLRQNYILFNLQDIYTNSVKNE